jgi:hypothetical protein
MLKIIEEIKIVTGYKLNGEPMYRTGYICECPICNKQVTVDKLSRANKQKSCKDCRGKLRVTHGLSDKPYYYIWQAMIQRCTNPKNARYHCYGGKGITVCDDWLTFEGFWKDNESKYRKGLTIDRIDSSKGYNPDNVQWISHSRNSAKTSRAKPVKCTKLRGAVVEDYQEFISVAEAARVSGTSLRTIENNLKSGRPNRKGYIWEYL